MSYPASSDQARWEREEDANTLARAEEVKGNPSRLAGAQQQAQIMLTEAKDRNASLAKVAAAKSMQQQHEKQAKPVTGKSGVVDMSNHPALGGKK